MNMKIFGGIAMAAAMMLTAGQARGDIVMSSTQDCQVLFSAPSTYILDDQFTCEIGYNGIRKCYVVPFQLPAKPAGASVVAADLVFQVQRGSAATAGNVDLYALTPRTAGAVLTSDYFAGPLDAGATMLQENFATAAGTITSAYTALHTDATADASLAAYLNAAYTTVGAGGWVFFRLSSDNASVPNQDYYQVYSANWGQFIPARVPQLDITFAVPTPGAGAMLAAAGVLASRRRRTR